ncbi:pantothenate kinase [Pleurocapsales cyanobacterium LEGE 10410]|nr:pantothenate kinase [Pleurocapsales cyanobacterium LEGE 10410]
MNESNWLALAIGNSRLHWAWFKHDNLIETWDTRHLSIAVEHHLPQELLANGLLKQDLTNIPVYLASVVPAQTELWQNYGELNLITIKDVKLSDTYPTMGVDRALAAWGASVTYTQPCLIIDGGTALTFTTVDGQKFLGGAILPGLRSQLTSLKQKTAALPAVELPATLPPRWASNTDQAIASGIIYTTITGIHSYIVDWLEQFPHSKIIFTGGDAELLAQYLHLQFAEIAHQTVINHNLAFWGMLLYRQQKTSP